MNSNIILKNEARFCRVFWQVGSSATLGEPVVLVDGNLSHNWTVDKIDEDDNAYIYRVDEVEIPEGYKKSVSEDGLTVTNTYIKVVPEPVEPVTTTVTGGKLPVTSTNSYTFILLCWPCSR